MQKSKTRIMAVDDDVQVLLLLRRTLEAEGYNVITANSGLAAITKFEQHSPELVLLDIVMPDIDGYAVCQRIRNSSLVPIIILTALADGNEIIRGLDAGADDYLSKPFLVGVLLARVKAVLRRSLATYHKLTPDIFKCGNLELEFARRQVTVDHNIINLTHTEFHLLSELVLNMGKVLTHEYLLKNVWGSEYKDERQYLHVFIRSLRTKLELHSKKSGTIDSLSGVGYRFSGLSDPPKI